MPDNLSKPLADTPESTPFPEAVRSKLDSLGLNGNIAVRAEADLDGEGRWAKRYLVATDERVIVISMQAPVEGFRDNKLDAILKSPRNGADDDISVDFDESLKSLSSFEIKNLVGSSAIEARQKPESFSGSPGTGIGRVVELLRASNSHSRELSNAVRQLQHLGDGKATDNVADDTKWQRQTCPTCGRALPVDSSVCPFCVNKWQALRRLLGYLGP